MRAGDQHRQAPGSQAAVWPWGRDEAVVIAVGAQGGFWVEVTLEPSLKEKQAVCLIMDGDYEQKLQAAERVGELHVCV